MMQTVASRYRTNTERSVRKVAAESLCLGIAVGAGVAFFKGDVAGVRAVIGNLVAPWLIVCFFCVCYCHTLRSLIATTWFSTAFSVITFYAIQGTLWGMVTRYSWRYDLFWVIAGSTACVTLALAVKPILRGTRACFAGWAAMSAIFAAAYGSYWIYLGSSLSDFEVATCLAATLIFIMCFVATLLGLRNSHLLKNKVVH